MEKINPNWINPNRVKYFNLSDYLSQIRLQDNVLYHMEETALSFEEYLKKIGQYCDYDASSIIGYWLDNALLELQQSCRLEGHIFSLKDLAESDLFFDKTTISHNRIKRIHEFVCNHSNTNAKVVGEYRSNIIDIGVFLDDNSYQTYWYGCEAADIKKFIDSFIEYFRQKGVSELYNNPFVKAALVHLLFVRIHPFSDGNGRTARIIQNISFTNEINRIYDTKLKISPLNISQSISSPFNRHDYADRINTIFFDLDHPETNNIAINKWIDFILYMYDEQIYYHTSTNRLNELESIAKYFEKDNFDKEISSQKYSQMRVSKLVKQP